jgi:predicted TPR repeat methyltransferase
MANKQTPEWLGWICTHATTAELRQKYNAWADTYDQQVGPVWEQVPTAAAAMLANHLSDKHSRIIDIGAGTGLTGAALAAQGFQQLIAIDIADDMLAQAAEKDVYTSLICCAIGDDTFMQLAPAQGIIATGVFAENHAGADELNLLQQTLDSEGVLVLTARQSFLPELEPTFKQPQWASLASVVLPVYADSIHLLAYKKRPNPYN